MADSELRPTHLPTDEHFARWAQRSRDQPLRMLSSACLTGLAVGYDGSDYGGYPAARALIERPEVRTFGFCPEDFAFGTPVSGDPHAGLQVCWSHTEIDPAVEKRSQQRNVTRMEWGIIID